MQLKERNQTKGRALSPRIYNEFARLAPRCKLIESFAGVVHSTTSLFHLSTEDEQEPISIRTKRDVSVHRSCLLTHALPPVTPVEITFRSSRFGTVTHMVGRNASKCVSNPPISTFNVRPDLT